MIYAERIRLRAVEPEDLPRFVEWLNDPEVIHGLTIYLPMSLADEKKWYEGLSNLPAHEKPLAIDIKIADGWKHVGACGFHDVELNHRACEIGISIGDKSAWHQGYGQDVIRLMLKHAFATLNLNRVRLRVHADNPRAIHVYEKCGFVQEGRQREALYKDGRYVDLIHMGILKSEWDHSNS
jgi:RimJ/RimL family protein N-acetyltransferase